MTSLALIGAGPVGVAAAKALIEDGCVSSVDSIVDLDSGRRAHTSSGFGAMGYESVEELPSTRGLAVVAFSSRGDAVVPVIHKLLALGYSIVTTCEELANPSSQIREELDLAARKAKAVVIVTGANPGFIMDRLPLLLAGGCREVREIRVIRRLDTRKRRLPLIEKTGHGLSEEDFRKRARSRVIGHVGLEASLGLVAEGLNWPTDNLRTSIEPILGEDGLVVGQHQMAHLESSKGQLHYELTMSSTVDNSIDKITIDGSPPIEVRFLNGYHGDLGTTARIVTSGRLSESMEPGFYRPTDVPLHG